MKITAIALFGVVMVSGAAYAADYGVTNTSPQPSKNNQNNPVLSSQANSLNAMAPAAAGNMKDWSACKTDIKVLCGGVKGDSNLSGCLQSHASDVSKPCAASKAFKS